MKRTTTQRGVTAIELIVALLISMIVIGAAFAIFYNQHRGAQAVADVSGATQSARLTLEQLERELRMAGFGVIGADTFTEAKTYSMQFRGDVNADIVATLGADAAAGATSIKVALNPNRDAIDSTESIFLNGNGNVELVPAAQSGTVVDFGASPATIRLATGLQNAYPANATLIRTIETVRYAVSFPAGTLTRNNVTVADRLANLEFHYYDLTGDEMVPDVINGLTQTQRAAIRRIEVRMQAGGAGAASAPHFIEEIEMRNMGNRPFKVDTTPPAAPTNLHMTRNDTCGQFDASWTPPTTNADGTPLEDLAGFKVYFGTSSGVYLVPPFTISDATATSATVQDIRLNNFQTYYVAVSAYDSSFNESVKSAEISFDIIDNQPPAAPPTADASATVGSVALTWTAPADPDVRGYRVYRGTAPNVATIQANRVADETTLTAGVTTFADAAVAACTTYYYKVSAVDCANEGAASYEVYGNGATGGGDYPTANVTNTTPPEATPSPPSVISAFQALPRNQDVDLYWTNSPDANFVGVVIRMSTTGYPTNQTSGTLAAQLTGSPGQMMQQSVANLVNGVKYYFSIFAYNKCGDYSAVAQASATPTTSQPLVNILSPLNGSTVTTGQVTFQVQAYDPDAPGVNNPASFGGDDGKGIANVKMWVAPDPGTSQFPVTTSMIQYCGYGGTSNPCAPGSVSQWCDGAYQFYVQATGSDGSVGASPYITATIHNGGVYYDTTVAPTVAGAYNNVMQFGLTCDATATATLQGITLGWDTANARLTSVQVPAGTTIWQYSGAPATSGTAIAFPSGNQPTVNPNGKQTVVLTFTQMSTTLTGSAGAGTKALALQSASGFAVGDTAYVVSGSTGETDVVSAVSGNTLTLTNSLQHAYGAGSTVRHTVNADDVNMHGANMTAVFTYTKGNILNRTCTSSQMAWTVTTAPLFGAVEQDQPSANTSCSTVQTAVKVYNYLAVPVHAVIADQSGQGIASAYVYYYADSHFQSVAPTSGYASVAMTYNAGAGDWQATIPCQSNARIWLYFSDKDNANNTDRAPESGYYCYDYQADKTPPACPTGLTATVAASRQINLSWNANTEQDIQCYNIYRAIKGNAVSKTYTCATDQDSGTAGVQYEDTDNKLRTGNNCYDYYVTAVNLSGTESTGCSANIAGAGVSPCP